MKLVQFGAGSIGRSFIGQLFSRAGWEVVFVDIDKKVVDQLNRKRQYTVEIKDRNPGRMVIKNVRGVHGEDLEKISDELATARLAATAVGKKALPHIMKPIAHGLAKRIRLDPGNPLDIIICENVKDSASLFKRSLKKLLPADFPLEAMVGLVETSIGKMVPIMPEEQKREDPLLVYAEAYNTLIVDRNGFRGPIPDIPELSPKQNMQAYVDRKLYIHNLGHAILAYSGYISSKGCTYIWEAAEDKELYRITKAAMWESGKAIIEEYPEEFKRSNISEHIQDLLSRFGNRALGDTIYRVGRDLYRKLGPDDRLVGAARCCLKHGIFPRYIGLGIASALFFKAVDENGQMYENDRSFHREELGRGADHVLGSICRLE
ncbi:MAG: mannitol-1-phosphate 5-dehydrogenase, partial [Spirochaetota bacterium]